MLKLIEDSTSSFNKEEFLKGKKTSSLYSSHARIAEDKTFTEGKVKGYVKVQYRFYILSYTKVTSCIFVFKSSNYFHRLFKLL